MCLYVVQKTVNLQDVTRNLNIPSMARTVNINQEVLCSQWPSHIIHSYPNQQWNNLIQMTRTVNLSKVTRKCVQWDHSPLTRTLNLPTIFVLIRIKWNLCLMTKNCQLTKCIHMQTAMKTSDMWLEPKTACK